MVLCSKQIEDCGGILAGQDGVMQARAAFPRGLEQPLGSLRFGMDALLLAAFAVRHVKSHVNLKCKRIIAAELGSGCGAAIIALCLKCPAVSGLGLDREVSLIGAAQRNAQRLGLSSRLVFEVKDLTNLSTLYTLPSTSDVHFTAGKFDLVLCNPPFEMNGRQSPHQLREHALRTPEGREESLKIFCRASSMLLRHHGFFICIAHTSLLPQLCIALHIAKLGIQCLLPVRPHSDKPSSRLLLLARLHAADNIFLEKPLTLHSYATGNNKWTKTALRFCSWLK